MSGVASGATRPLAAALVLVLAVLVGLTASRLLAPESTATPAPSVDASGSSIPPSTPRLLETRQSSPRTSKDSTGRPLTVRDGTSERWALV